MLAAATLVSKDLVCFNEGNGGKVRPSIFISWSLTFETVIRFRNYAVINIMLFITGTDI